MNSIFLEIYNNLIKLTRNKNLYRGSCSHWTSCHCKCNFPFEEDFVILGPYRDKTMMKNAMTYEMWRQMDFNRPNITTKYVELIINGSYKGVYVFMEKLKRDKNRI